MKINGTEIIQTIDSPERGFVIGDTRLMRAAMNVFLVSRGQRTNHDFNQRYVGSRLRRANPQFPS
jgi:hypothetical protein